MSDNFLKLIPDIPQYVPSTAAIQNACELLSEYLPSADEISYTITADVRFIDQGQNWKRVLCPVCRAELDKWWWQQAVDAAYRAGFSNLSVKTPCCGAASSLNELQYEWPAGFAQAIVEVHNPSGDVDDDQLKSLEQILGCRLRKIWARY